MSGKSGLGDAFVYRMGDELFIFRVISHKNIVFAILTIIFGANSNSLQKPIGGRSQVPKRGRSVFAIFSAKNYAVLLLYIEGRGVTQEQASLKIVGDRGLEKLSNLSEKSAFK